jgi:hypothetical protein
MGAFYIRRDYDALDIKKRHSKMNLHIDGRIQNVCISGNTAYKSDIFKYFLAI